MAPTLSEKSSIPCPHKEESTGNNLYKSMTIGSLSNNNFGDMQAPEK